jgi:periodic tryptophan protein 1
MQCFLLTGNLLAVGTMEPYINIWDLDVMDTIDPVLTLGERKKKKSKKVRKNGSVWVDLPLEHAKI